MTPLRRRALGATAAMFAAAAAGAALRPRTLSASEFADPRLDDLFPADCQGWRVDPLSRAFVRPSDERGRVLGVYDRLLERVYIGADGHRVMLSAAYMANAFEGQALQLHRPEVCYRYAGYRVGPIGVTRLNIGSAAIQVTRLRADLPGRPEPITYWIVVDRTVPDDHTSLRWQRFRANLSRQVLDSLLVRVSSIDGDEERAYGIHGRFANALAAAVGPASSARIFGTGHPGPSSRSG